MFNGVLFGAKAIPGCISSLLFSAIFLTNVLLSRKLIGDANFYSGYFELNLTGRVTFEELSDATGKNMNYIKFTMPIIRFLYMNKFAIKQIDGKSQIVLENKTYRCECRNCGAPLDKSVYFNGECAYCGSSDLFARVITKNRFYSISTDFTKKAKRTDYQKNKLETIQKILLCIMIVLCVPVVICFCMVFDNLEKYNNVDWLREELFSTGSSYELIKRDSVDLILWGGVFFLVFAIAAYIMWVRQNSASVAIKCSKTLAGMKKPPLSDKSECCKWWLFHCGLI